ncbi:tyrosine-type recombinase/integrase [Acinetobacter variabilis]|uniref:tyrosine-type recombinase/integrase n=1 Tax=Acinetobacter variabilis TaxID=70346 RepID=UPI003D784FDC
MTRKRYLSDLKCDALKAKEKEYRVGDVPGLYLRIQTSGKKSWQMRKKNSQGKWAWIGLGTYPEVSLKEAREKVRDIEKGIVVPLTRKEKALKLQEENKELFEQLMWEWLDTKKNSWTAQTFKKEVQSIERHLLPVFGKRKFAEIKTQEWQKFFQGKQRKEKIFNRVEKLLSYVRNAYDYAIHHERMQRNPVATLKKYLDKNIGNNMKHIDIRELPEMLQKIRNYRTRQIAIGLELLILMFPRPGELRIATWDQFDFDLKIWKRPGSMMKMRKDHDIPLSPQVIKLLEELKAIPGRESKYLFPSRDSAMKPISNLTFNAALNRMGYKDKQNPHGFRHIAATQLNDILSDKQQVIEACLAHLKAGMPGTYNKGQHFRERIKVMEWWGNYIDSIVTKCI